MPTGHGPRPSYSIAISSLYGGGARWRLPRMGAYAPVMCQSQSAARRISIHQYMHPGRAWHGLRRTGILTAEKVGQNHR